MKNLKLQLKTKKIYLAILFLFLLFLIRPIFPAKAQAANPGEVVINEVMWMGSSKSYADEWLELKNTTQNKIPLNGWYLTRNTGVEEKLKIDFTDKSIPANSYFIIAYKNEADSILAIAPDILCKTYLFLHNEKLKISLYDSANKLIDVAGNGGKPFFPPSPSTKSSMERGLLPGDGALKENWHTAISSINFDAGASELGTPGAENSPPSTSTPSQPSPLPSLPLSEIGPEGEEIVALISIKDARQKVKGEGVLVEGIITVAPGTFSARYFYLQDGTAGIQIYFSKNFPSLSVGQKVTVLGTLSEAYNEKRIKISKAEDISIIGQEQEMAPISLKTGQVNEDLEGRLVKTAGKVVEPKGNLFYLDDGSGKIKIYIKKETGIQKPRLSQGLDLEITGIVSQYKEEYRILPRKNEDLKTASGEVLTTATIKKTSSKKTGVGDEEELAEEEIIEEEGEGKVLGAVAEKASQNWWWILLAAMILAGGGYLVYDYQNYRGKGNGKIWSRIYPTLKGWRARLPFGRTRKW